MTDSTDDIEALEGWYESEVDTIQNAAHAGVWIDKYGVEHSISRMKTSHIKACLGWLKYKSEGTAREEAKDIYADKMCKELARRGEAW